MSSRPSRSGPLRRWAQFTTRKPWVVGGGWIGVFAILAVLSSTVGGTLVDKFSVPGADSQQAIDLLKSDFPSAAGDSAQVVFYSETGISADAAVQQQVQAFVDEAQALPDVIFVASPFDPNSPAISPDGTIGYATVQYALPASEIDVDSVDALFELVHATESDTLQVEVGGQVGQELPEPGVSELVGVVAAIIILLFMFGSVLAMGLPIVTAGAGVGLSVLIVTVLANFITFSTTSSALISMMGLGVGIDYALFIITRFREERAHGHDVNRSVVSAVDTAGRSVLFAGTVVVIALLGLFVTGIPFIGLLGLSGAIAIVVSMCVAIGLMPPLLKLIGPHLDRWSFLPNKQTPIDESFGYKHTSRIQKAPLVWLVVALIILGGLGGPALLNAQLGSADAGTAPAGSTNREAYDLIAQGFGPGANGPLLIVIDHDDKSPLVAAEIENIATTLAATEGVAFGAPATLNETGTTAILQLVPLTAPQDEATNDLITNLRDDVIPDLVGDSGLNVYVGGATATFADLAEATTSALPLYILLVAGLSVLLLMAVFRSVLVPLKAAFANLLSFFAGYGVIVLVFQEGFLGINDWFGVDRTGPIESFLPILLFAILFGLLMDYEIFLISRVHEAWNHRQDNAWALRHGIGASGKVVLAAGAIMTSVFLAFTIGDGRVIKELGLGLGSAILIDVLVVRMMFVPAFMSLVGNANWWIPGWLDRILPRLDVEGEPVEGEFADVDLPVAAAAAD
jgi:RND superfamily putative drug exporter